MSDALPAAPVPSPERLKELYEGMQRHHEQRHDDERAMEAMGVVRGECHAGLAPGMQLEVDFENMERRRVVVTLIRGLDTGLHVALVPFGPQDTRFSHGAPAEHVIERIYPALAEAPDAPGGRVTLIDLRGDIVGLRPAPDVDHSAWIPEARRRQDTLWEALQADTCPETGDASAGA